MNELSYGDIRRNKMGTEKLAYYAKIGFFIPAIALVGLIISVGL